MQHLIKVLLINTVLLSIFCHSTMLLAANDGTALLDKYASLTEQLNTNQFKRPLYLVSAESPTRLKGDIYAVLDYPFAAVNKSLNDPKLGAKNWCDVLILHINTKYCSAQISNKSTILNVSMGKKNEQGLADAHHLKFDYKPIKSAAAEYFQVGLTAKNGPLGTHDYEIVLEAVALGNKQTFLHLTYAYSYGLAGRMAMKTYLATIGSGKVGFTQLNNDANNDTRNYISGVRGVVERNTFRYYLAIDAYLNALSAAPDKRVEQRLNHWFNATEQYPKQLHELDLNEYLDMKHKEIERQKTVQ